MNTKNTIEATLNKQDSSSSPTTTKTKTIVNQEQEKPNNASNKSNKHDINNKTHIATSSPASPPSASSSPTHEFSFTFSLHPSCSSKTTTAASKSLFPSYNKTKTSNNNNNSSSSSSCNDSFAIDLSPADDIFFHGHLLPLHFLSHLSVSPRSSTNSLDSFTLPVKELVHDKSPNTTTTTNTSTSTTNKSIQSKNDKAPKYRTTKNNKAFSLFGRRNQYQKKQEEQEQEEMESKEKQKKLGLDQLSRVIKRYAGMMGPMFLFNKNKSRRRKAENVDFHRGAYSFSEMSWRSSSNTTKPNSKTMMMMNRGRGGDYSAPASMRTSPTNSGLLVPYPTLCSPSSSSSDHSTLEELQAAIQAAIAHCKNSTNKDIKDTITF